MKDNKYLLIVTLLFNFTFCYKNHGGESLTYNLSKIFW